MANDSDNNSGNAEAFHANYAAMGGGEPPSSDHQAALGAVMQQQLPQFVNGAQNAYGHAVRLGSRFLEEGEKLWHQANLVGEGPKPLRVLCFLGGLATFVSSLLSLVNVVRILFGPPTYVIQIYLAVFGLMTMIIEAKDLPYLESFRPHFEFWYRFLTVPGGKGVFYFFIGSLCVSHGLANLLLFASGCYMAFLGVICVMVHFGMKQQLRNSGIDITVDSPQHQRVPMGGILAGGDVAYAPYPAAA